VYNPVAMDEARRVVALYLGLWSWRVRFAAKPMDALTDAEALVLVSEWKAFHSLPTVSRPR
jgi:UDPglucose 6-dehydrogenase